MRDSVWIGIDFGTSGCRVIAIDQSDTILAQARYHFSANISQYPSPQQQVDILHATLQQVVSQIMAFTIESIAIDATSGSVMLCDVEGSPLSEMLMYNDRRVVQISQHLSTIIPKNSAAHGTVVVWQNATIYKRI